MSLSQENGCKKNNLPSRMFPKLLSVSKIPVKLSHKRMKSIKLPFPLLEC